MSALAKLTIKTIARRDQISPAEMRRTKLLKAIEAQISVADAAIRGEQHVITALRWTKNDAGERVRAECQRTIHPWFFAQDAGYYVPCKYGSRPIALTKDGNAVFVKQLSDIPNVLQTFYAATAAGEFDAAIEAVSKRRAR